MGARQRKWANDAMAKLHQSLGGKCAWCKTEFDLECDCIDRRGHEHHGLPKQGRVCFYRRQARAGNLQLLCKNCHEAKTRFEAQGIAGPPYNNSPCDTHTSSSRGCGNYQQQRKSLSPRGNHRREIGGNL